MPRATLQFVSNRAISTVLPLAFASSTLITHSFHFLSLSLLSLSCDLSLLCSLSLVLSLSCARALSLSLSLVLSLSRLALAFTLLSPLLRSCPRLATPLLSLASLPLTSPSLLLSHSLIAFCLFLLRFYHRRP